MQRGRKHNREQQSDERKITRRDRMQDEMINSCGCEEAARDPEIGSFLASTKSDNDARAGSIRPDSGKFNARGTKWDACVYLGRGV